jgi:hypothetical protein
VVLETLRIVMETSGDRTLVSVHQRFLVFMGMAFVFKIQLGLLQFLAMIANQFVHVPHTQEDARKRGVERENQVALAHVFLHFSKSIPVVWKTIVSPNTGALNLSSMGPVIC